MLPKKIYLNWLKAYNFDEWSAHTWSEQPVDVVDSDFKSREYTDISQMWRDPSEAPQNNDAIIIYRIADIMCRRGIPYGFMTMSRLLDTKRGWQDWTRINGLQAWAYLDDLLPKGGNV